MCNFISPLSKGIYIHLRGNSSKDSRSNVQHPMEKCFMYVLAGPRVQTKLVENIRCNFVYASI